MADITYLLTLLTNQRPSNYHRWTHRLLIDILSGPALSTAPAKTKCNLFRNSGLKFFKLPNNLMYEKIKHGCVRWASQPKHIVKIPT